MSRSSPTGEEGARGMGHSWSRERELTNRTAMLNWGPTVRLMLLRSVPTALAGALLLGCQHLLQLFR